MKKLLLLVFVSVFLTSCYVYESPLKYGNSNVSGTTKKWVEYEMNPSDIINNGEPFFIRKLIDNSTLLVSYNSKVGNNSTYFKNLLWQDLGWERVMLLDGKSEWQSNADAPRPKVTHLYVNPRRRVAVYLGDDREPQSFLVTITK
jgi:hypothetical protein